MTDNEHQIKRQVFDVELSNKENASEIQQKLVDIIKLRLLSSIEKIFDEVCPPGVVIRLPKLEINLGEIDMHRLESELEYQLRQHLKIELEKSVEEIKYHSRQGFEIIQSVQSKVELIKMFLITGALPWWAPNFITSRQFNISDFIIDISKESSGEFNEILRYTLNNPTALNRMLLQIGDDGLKNIVNSKLIGLGDSIIHIKTEFELIKSGLSKDLDLRIQEIEIELWKEVFELLSVDKRKIISNTEIISRLVKRISDLKHFDEAEVIYKLKKVSTFHAPKLPEITKYIKEQPASKEELKEEYKKTKEEQQLLEQSIDRPYKLLGKNFTIEELRSYWSLRSNRVYVLSKLPVKEIYEIVRLNMPNLQARIIRLEKALSDVVVQRFWKETDSNHIKTTIVEQVMEQQLKLPRPVFKPSSIIETVLEDLRKKVDLPKRNIVEVIKEHIEDKELIKDLEEVEEQIKSERKPVEKGDHVTVRNFLLFGIYPELQSIPVEVFIKEFIEKSAATFENIIWKLSPRQMLRLVERVENELPEPEKTFIHKKIIEIRGVGPKQLSSGSKVSLTEVLSEWSNVVYIVQQWIYNPVVKEKVEFTFIELVSGMITTFGSKSVAYFKSLSSSETVLLIKRLESETPNISAESEEWLDQYDESSVGVSSPSPEHKEISTEDGERDDDDSFTSSNAKGEISEPEEDRIIDGETVADDLDRDLEGGVDDEDAVKDDERSEYEPTKEGRSEISESEKGSEGEHAEGETFDNLGVNQTQKSEDEGEDIKSELKEQNKFTDKEQDNTQQETLKREKEKVLDWIEKSQNNELEIDEEEKVTVKKKDEAVVMEQAFNEPIYIRNAGLVILYPFLVRYFGLLDLIEEKKRFKSEDAVQKAVHLIHFLAYGTKEGKEYEMTLNKILCGMPLPIPVESNVEITDKEIEMSESLLNGIIGNWKALKKSSIDNLRGSFLIREGRLEQTEKVWVLKVEQRGFDVLVDQISWSFNIVKLPWMEKAIHVEWR